MNYKSTALLFLMLAGVQLHAANFEIKDLGMMDLKMYRLKLSNDALASSLTVTPGSSLVVFGTVFDAIDLTTVPVEVSHVVYAVRAIKAKYDLNDIAMLGDLYTALEQRGHGYAKRLMTLTCEELFNQGTKAVILVPDPFEYENEKQVLVSDETKIQQLVKFYQSLGFKLSDDHKFMYLEKKS